MNESSLKTYIKQQVKKLVKQIRGYSKSQKKLWQQIPWLTLEADGRNGYLDNFSRAYHHGFWAIESSKSMGYYSVYVDLETGKLVDAFFASHSFSMHDIDIPKKSELKPAKNENVLRISIDELDASQIIQELKEKIRQPYSKSYYPEKQEKWRKDLRGDLGLEKIYKRKK